MSASVNMQQEYNQQVPVSSYYLLHGKYNSGKGTKQKSSSVKAAETLVPGNASVGGKGNSIMTMPHMGHQITKPAPKSHSHGISTPTTNINNPMMHTMVNPSPNQGSVMAVPKLHLATATNTPGNGTNNVGTTLTSISNVSQH